MFYDYALTFSCEVELFWKGPVSAATYLYFANRYLTTIEKIFNFFWWIPNLSPEVRSVRPWSPSQTFVGSDSGLGSRGLHRRPAGCA